jgi:hypothetical protein
VGRKRQTKAARSQLETIQSTSNTGSAIGSAQRSRNDVEMILGLPRIVRMILIIIPTFALVVILQPIVDTIYLRYFFTMETRGAASIITAALALIFFLAGWWLIVGTVGEQPEQRRATQVYLYLCIGVVLLAVLWIGYLYLTNLRLQE